ncbi:LPXTG cell wall anchor domain-containing protein [Streptomyces sp. NBC_00483]|uniref:LPXTG cell wall anchor domain-containing protein n=1 Tax=Streptomyces sp. NBC_00483 TaxID=2975756 RepID=UPI002E19F930
MQIRQILATAAVAAVTAPVALLSVSPAYAGTQSSVQTQEKSSIAKLKKAVKEARAAYRAAVAAEQALEKELDATTAPEHPLMVALADAKKDAEAAAKAKDEADAAVVAAEQKLAEANAGEDEAAKAAAEKALTDAKAAATGAATAKTDADAKVTAADTALDDNRVAIARKIHKAQQDVKAALATKEAAEKALADAKDEQPGPDEPTDPECKEGAALKATLPGLPSKIAAGSTVDFRLRLTNGTGRTLDEVLPFASVGAGDKSDKDITSKLHLKSKQGGQWKSVPADDYAGRFTNVKAGAHVDLPLRLSIDRSAPAGYGISAAVGAYFNEDATCGVGDLVAYNFTINPVGAGNSDTPAGEGNKPKPQGSASPVATSGSGNGSGTTDGSLASTGSSSALPTIGLAGGAAVVVGAGAVFVMRRRKADANS